jgi:single-strand DNA-binding protein
MASFNKVILLGNVTRDPELRYIANGTAVTDIGLAVNDRRKTATGEWVEETTFVDVTLWGRTAEIAGEYVTKGSPLLIDGRLMLDTWEKDGKKNSKLRVVGERLVLLGNRQGAPGPEGSRGPEGAPRSNRPAAAGRPDQQPEDLPDFSQATYDSPGRDGGGRGSDAVSPGGSDDDIPF